MRERMHGAEPTRPRPVPAEPSISSFDLATRDKVQQMRGLLALEGGGLALDIGSGTGYTAQSVFGDLPTVCVDFHEGNLHYYRERVRAQNCQTRVLCAVATATALPFRNGLFRFVLCSEVLEHLEDDDTAAREIARVLAADGRILITVPYSGLGFTSFLEILGVKTVHDYPGPEHHIRSGYDERSLRGLLRRHGLVVERHAFYFRFFTRILADLVSLAHLLYQRMAHGRRAWTWSDAAAAEKSWVFRLYAWMFPLLWALSRVDAALGGLRGFGLIAVAAKENALDGVTPETPSHSLGRRDRPAAASGTGHGGSGPP
jgi:ubiquinone/menaquinone biosynthesis C-methylase UbiE